MKKSFISIILLMCFFVGFICIDAKATFTVATFADPSGDSNNPLFTVDFLNHSLTGGWANGNTGLNLQVSPDGINFTDFDDVWFEMAEVDIIDTFGNTGDGEINFYENGDSTTPLITINFESGYVSRFFFGADEVFVTDNVTITGSGITGDLSEEEFSFSFTNLAYLEDSEDMDDGFTATAALTSSAIPEPATICLLGFGVFGLIRRKK